MISKNSNVSVVINLLTFYLTYIYIYIYIYVFFDVSVYVCRYVMCPCIMKMVQDDFISTGTMPLEETQDEPSIFKYLPTQMMSTMPMKVQ